MSQLNKKFFRWLSAISSSPRKKLLDFGVVVAKEAFEGVAVGGKLIGRALPLALVDPPSSLATLNAAPGTASVVSLEKSILSIVDFGRGVPPPKNPDDGLPGSRGIT